MSHLHALPRVLKCSACGAPTSFGAPFCAYCRGPLTWGAVPLLSRGPIIAHCDATKQDLPKRSATGSASEVRGPEGVLVTSIPAKSVVGDIGMARRHGCIVIRATALDTNTCVGVVARRHPMPGACGYTLLVTPFYRVFDFTRYTASPTQRFSSPLRPNEFHPRVAPVGRPNEIELRCADSILQVFVNGEHIAACIDATFGFGWFGWRIEPTDQRAARAMIHSITLHAVA